VPKTAAVRLSRNNPRKRDTIVTDDTMLMFFRLRDTWTFLESSPQLSKPLPAGTIR
jgi:hypothetical protein